MASTGEAWRLGRRPALDGVRGIAVLLVLVCHTAVPHAWGAGAVGVTVFFTLSGFLITALLLEEHAHTGTVSLRRFYARRLRRLGPAFVASTALVVVFGVALGASWFFTWGDLWPVLLYVGNWPLAAGGPPHALAGTWSLAVEEQFYLVWPLVVLAVVRRGGPAAVGATAAGVLAGSLSLRALMFVTGGTSTAVYYGTPTTASALAAGALLAVLLHQWGTGSLRVPWWPALVVLAAVSMRETTRDWWYIAPVLATAATVLLLHLFATTAPAWIEVRALRWFGTRSYALYLIHSPLAWVLRERTGLPWPALVVVVVGVSGLLAEASWRWIEQPAKGRRQDTPEVRRRNSNVAVAVAVEGLEVA